MHCKFNLFQVLFDALGCLRKYETALDILKEFFELRLERYAMRKAWLEGMLAAESDKLNSQARFILEKIEGHIIIGKRFVQNHFMQFLGDAINWKTRLLVGNFMAIFFSVGCIKT